MNQSIHFVPEHLLADAELALKEGRLRWRNTDAEGRPANGGDAPNLNYLCKELALSESVPTFNVCGRSADNKPR